MCDGRVYSDTEEEAEKKNGKAAPTFRERENIEYKISYFIINIPFSVPFGFSSCLFVSFGGARPDWLKNFPPIRFSTHIHNQMWKVFLRRQDNKRKDSTFYRFAVGHGPYQKNLNSERTKKKKERYDGVRVAPSVERNTAGADLHKKRNPCTPSYCAMMGGIGLLSCDSFGTDTSAASRLATIGLGVFPLEYNLNSKK